MQAIHDGQTINLADVRAFSAARLIAEIYAALDAEGYTMSAINLWRVAMAIVRMR